MKTPFNWSALAGSIFLFFALGIFLLLLQTAYFFDHYALEKGFAPSFGQVSFGLTATMFLSLFGAAFLLTRQMALPKLWASSGHLVLLWAASVVFVSLPLGVGGSLMAGGAAKSLVQVLSAAGATNLISEVNPRMETQFNLWQGKVDTRMTSDQGKLGLARTAEKAKTTLKKEAAKPALKNIIEPAAASARDVGMKLSLIGVFCVFFGAIGTVLGALLERRLRKA